MAHGEEGTHSVCDNRLKFMGGKSPCCVCSPHFDCSLEAQNSPSQSNQDPWGDGIVKEAGEKLGRIYNQDKELDEILTQAFADGASDTMWQNDRHVEIFAASKQRLIAWRDAHTEQAILDEHTKWILPTVEAAHEYEQQENGSGIQFFDNERLGRLNELKQQLDKGE